MPITPFVGPSYQSSSVDFDCQRTVNMYLEKSESGTSKSPARLVGTPGLRVYQTFPLFPIRNGWKVNDRAFFVSGNTLYESFIDRTYTARGTLGTSIGAVGMSDNGSQLIVVDGPNGYILNLSTNVFTQISSPGFRGANTVTFIGGYFVLAQPNSDIFYWSGLYDGTSYDPLDFASAEGSPDNITSVITLHGQLWVFGRSSVQIYYTSGDADLPFAPVSGASMEYGCAAPLSVSKTANTVFWLGQDKDGAGVVWMAAGYQPQRISTYAIENKLRSYAANYTATGYTYQEDGHYFYVINFPSASTTFVYDANEQQWHERQSLVDGVLDRHRGQCHVFAFDSRHLVGDYENGNVYEQSLDIYEENEKEIIRKRVSPHSVGPQLERVTYNEVQIDMETGVGVSDGESQDVDPQAMLRWSDDGGHTWSNYHTASVGKIGRYRTRNRWRRLGRARDRVFEWSYSCRTKVSVIAGYMEVTDGTN